MQHLLILLIALAFVYAADILLPNSHPENVLISESSEHTGIHTLSSKDVVNDITPHAEHHEYVLETVGNEDYELESTENEKHELARPEATDPKPSHNDLTKFDVCARRYNVKQVSGKSMKLILQLTQLIGVL